MRLGVVSDVHNNVAAFSYALDHLGGCDALFCLGDLVSDYRVDPPIIRLAEDAGVLAIAGNHEKTILLHSGSVLRERLDPADLAYLRRLPGRRHLAVAGRRVLMVHGAPWDNDAEMRCTYLWEHDAHGLERAADNGFDVVLIGHTHTPMAVTRQATLILNPGSCGEARGPAGLTFAQLDFDSCQASVYSIRFGQPPEVLLQAPIAGPP